MTRVLFVLGALQPGGIQTFLLSLLRYFDRGDVAMDVCTMSRDAGSLEGEVKKLGAAVYTTSGRRAPWAVVRDLEQIMAGKQYDAVHATRSSSYLAPVLRAGKRLGVPVRIAHYQNIRRADGVLRGMGDSILRRMVLSDATSIIGVFEGVLDSHFGARWRNDARFEVIRNPVELASYTRARRVDLRRQFGFQDDDIVIGHSGRFSEAKNHQAIVTVASELRGAKFLLAGDGPLRPEIERVVKEKNLSDTMKFIGWRHDMPDVLSAMDIFFFPSFWEGCPISLLEAQAAGLPAITSEVPTCREILPPELKELTFPLRDLSLARDHLKRLVESESERKRLGEAASRHAQQFDIGVIAPRFRALYRGQSTHSD